MKKINLFSEIKKEREYINPQRLLTEKAHDKNSTIKRMFPSSENSQILYESERLLEGQNEFGDSNLVLLTSEIEKMVSIYGNTIELIKTREFKGDVTLLFNEITFFTPTDPSALVNNYFVLYDKIRKIPLMLLFKTNGMSDYAIVKDMNKIDTSLYIFNSLFVSFKAHYSSFFIYGLYAFTFIINLIKENHFKTNVGLIIILIFYGFGFFSLLFENYKKPYKLLFNFIGSTLTTIILGIIYTLIF